jgi:hypothetical protein
MDNRIQVTVPLGELVAAVFDRAAMWSKDQREVSRLATMAVMQILRRSRSLHAPRR